MFNLHSKLRMKLIEIDGTLQYISTRESGTQFWWDIITRDMRRQWTVREWGEKKNNCYQSVQSCVLTAGLVSPNWGRQLHSPPPLSATQQHNTPSDWRHSHHSDTDMTERMVLSLFAQLKMECNNGVSVQSCTEQSDQSSDQTQKAARHRIWMSWWCFIIYIF